MLGEPTLKMVRYQRGFGFFDAARVGSAVHFLNLSEEALDPDLTVVLDRIVADVERLRPGIVIVDSFRTIGMNAGVQAPAGAMGLDRFVQRLSLHLTTWDVTSFLLGEYTESEQRHPVFTVADGVLLLTQAVDRNSVVRKLQVVKVRGQAQMPGLHTFRMSDSGIQVFPRIPEQQTQRRGARERGKLRLPTGVPGLDEMMGGGIPAGDAVMLAGPAGTGKTTFAMQFVINGLRKGEPSVIAVFEEYPEEYQARARKFGMDLEGMIEQGLLRIVYLRPLDLSVDETLAAITEHVQEIEATRVVIDSLSGFQIALAPTFREDFQESLYRLVGALTAIGVTVFMTVEVIEDYPNMTFTGERVSFITDAIIMQRYVEIEGYMRKVLAVVKMRGSQHSKALRLYDLTPTGAVMGETLGDYIGILSGQPERQARIPELGHDGLTDRESGVLNALIRAGAPMTATDLEARTLLPHAELTHVLARLVTLDYIAAVDSGGGDAHYRAVVRQRRR